MKKISYFASILILVSTVSLFIWSPGALYYGVGIIILVATFFLGYLTFFRRDSINKFGEWMFALGVVELPILCFIEYLLWFYHD